MSEHLDLYLMTLAGLVKARVDGDWRVELLDKMLDTEDVREVVKV